MTKSLRVVLSSVSLLLTVISSGPSGLGAQQAAQDLRSARGQSATLLPDGSVLLLGGESSPASGAIYDPSTRTTRPVTGLLSPRAWHTATVMPDGTVLVVGGVEPTGGLVPHAEQFDPVRREFKALTDVALTPRARHTATLLSDGRVLLAGGDPIPGGLTAELWSPRDPSSYPVAVPARRVRVNHTARLMSDGRVLMSGGHDERGAGINEELFDPATDTFLAARTADSGSSSPPAVVGSNPEPDATDVSVDARIAVRFGQPLDVRSVHSRSVVLEGPSGALAGSIVPAEEGRLVFVTPVRSLAHSTKYVLSVRHLRSAAGGQVPATTITFTTASDRRADSASPRDPDVWVPSRAGWRSEGSDSPWRRMPPLQAPAGVTALAGQVLLLSGRPLAGVTLEIDGRSVETDRSGRFLLKLENLPAGWHELTIDGTTASAGRRTYGRFEYGLSILARRTNVLPFTIWMPVIDTAHAVRIPSPTTQETVITTPWIPGLELHLPSGSVVKDEDGKIVHEISITPIPVDRPPFPLPNGVKVPIYFTIQPGGAYVHVPRTSAGYGSARGAWLVYPNYTKQPIGQRLPFWQYDAEEFGWHVYGFGEVTRDGRQVRPDAGVVLYEFTGAMLGVDRDPPAGGPFGIWDGDPVDLATGLFVMEKMDLYLPDVLPLGLSRTYRPNDEAVRPFGVGSQHPYDLWFGNQVAFQEVDLILPDGAPIHYVRTSPGTGLSGAIYEHTSSPTAFYGSKLVYTGSGWDLSLKDGTTFVFPIEAPLQVIRDRFGNTITITRTGGPLGNIAKVTSPNGRYIEFTYDTSNRITQAKDNLGRTVGYEYDAGGRLWKVTDAKGGVTEYTYDGAHRMLTIKDPRGIVYLENEYDTAGRIVNQTQADGGEYEFDYTVNGSGQITQTEVTNPRGFVRRVSFNSARYPTSDIAALGETEEQTTTYTRLSGSQLVETITDELGRVTRYQYDSKGNVTSLTRLYGTSDAKTTSFTYHPTFSLVATVTDPLNHTTTYAYDSQGRLVSTTDALNHQSTFTTNEPGFVLSATDALNKTTTFAYDVGDLVGVATPLGHTATRFVDVAGRLLQVKDARGAVTRFEYDNLNQLTKIIDPLNGQTTFTYDGNGNLLTLTDARSKTTTWTYDDMDRVETRTDPLNRDESFTYDLMGNLVMWTDRKGQVMTYQYDGLDWQTFVGFGTTGTPPTYASTTTTTYDAGDRPTEIVESVAGTIERTYDLLDRLTAEVTPEGTITYTYDGADRRATMQVAGQTQVSYNFDNADRLTGITQGAAAVTIGYDNADRRTSLTLPNGIVVEYGYDDNSRLTGLTYKQGTTTLGNLTYTYDAVGQRTSVGGTWARTGLPAALTSATYDNANQVTTFGGASFTYDDNGNLTSDGVRSYTWNARDQLTSLTGPVNGSFAYDGVGRRRSKTVGGTTVQFLYDGLNPVQELASGTPTANLLTGPGIDEFFTRTDGAGVRNYLTEALGSSVALVDGSGTVQTSYTYEPYGGTTTSGGSTSNTFGFTGREADGTGLLFYRARFFDPRLQRFIAEDPLGFAAGDPNLHAYVFNSPTELTDPTGEFAWLVLPAAGCAGGALGAGLGAGWSGRKLAAGCAAGAMLGLGAWGAGPAVGAAATAAARAAATAAARAAARAAAAATRAATRAARATATAAGKGARAARQAYARTTGNYQTHTGGGGRPQPVNARTQQYTRPGEPLIPRGAQEFLTDAIESGITPGPPGKTTPGSFAGSVFAELIRSLGRF